MDDLVKFLRARLNEDEQAAKAAKPGPWHADGGSVYATHLTDEVVDYTESAAHIARHDPARVLTDVDAKRQIVDRYAWLREHGDTGGTAWVLPLLALPYADHPDYRDEWRP